MSAEVLNRWKSRALRAEMKLYRAGLSTYCPADLYSDAEYLLITLEHKDGRSPHVSELIDARERLALRDAPPVVPPDLIPPPPAA